MFLYCCWPTPIVEVYRRLADLALAAMARPAVEWPFCSCFVASFDSFAADIGARGTFDPVGVLGM